MTLDLEFVRGQFDQLADDPTFVFASNAGGSLVCNQVNSLLDHYNHHTRVQPYYPFSPSAEAGVAMDRSKRLWADGLAVDEDELTLGASTSLNTYVLSHAIGGAWGPGDNIVVTNQDHEANVGAWRRKAEERQAEIREWQVDPESGLLDPEDLYALLDDNTRWVFYTHCSNVIGTVNPVAEISRGVKSRSAARTLVDGVAYAPHHVCRLRELGVDAYVFSLYKVYGPHQSLLYVSRDMQDSLQSQAHYFLADDVSKYLNPAGPQHAQVAGCAGVIDYFTALHEHHGGTGVTTDEQVAGAHALMHAHEQALTTPLIDYIEHHADLRLLGKRHTRDGDRAPTIAFQPLRQSSASLAAALVAAGIGAENGDFYARRLIDALGLDPADGLVRISLLHYNRMEDVDRILRALNEALA